MLLDLQFLTKHMNVSYIKAVVLLRHAHESKTNHSKDTLNITCSELILDISYPTHAITSKISFPISRLQT